LKIEMNEAEMTSVFGSIQTGEDFKKLVSINGQNVSKKGTRNS